MEASRAIESVARDSYSRLIAYLSTRTRDVAGAEDALGDAFVSAIQTWTASGVPASPEAWLIAVARRKMIDRGRHERVEREHWLELLTLAESRVQADESPAIADERLPLLFVCAHPAIDRGMHAPLMLQVVMGISAERIARSFLVTPETMSQRLVRAKKKILNAGVAFRIPDASTYPGRLDSVLQAIYAAYCNGWEITGQTDSRREDLAEDALWLSRLLVDTLPEAPEAMGLLSLMLYCESRRDARRKNGEFVPLSDQNIAQWSVPNIREAGELLLSAAELGHVGRFQLEAAIQSVHVQRAVTGETNWNAITDLYRQLTIVSPTVGARVGLASAVAESLHADAGLAVLDELPPNQVASYQPYWAVKAHLLRTLRRDHDSCVHYDRAISLTDDRAVKRYLNRQKDLVGNTSV